MQEKGESTKFPVEMGQLGKLHTELQVTIAKMTSEVNYLTWGYPIEYTDSNEALRRESVRQAIARYIPGLVEVRDTLVDMMYGVVSVETPKCARCGFERAKALFES